MLNKDEYVLLSRKEQGRKMRLAIFRLSCAGALRLFYFVTLFFLGAHTASVAAGPSALWPNTVYDEQIPTFNEVLGYNVGEKITSHADMLRYFEALEAAAPERIKTFEYGLTWEGRKLIYAAIGNAKSIANLDALASGMQQLAEPEFDDADGQIAALPATVWLGYGVHGNEASSADAAMFTAYHLLAAIDEPISRKVLSNTVVFIDPLQNPDGRNRFISYYYSTVGIEHSPDRLSAEHNEPWPGGRTNHYLFDMNRDWLAQTQPETRGRIEVMNKYLPLVVIDFHEMGGDSSYYFAPPAKPYNPHMTETQIKNITSVGENLSRHFDRFGYDYFTREIFDAFYPGYGDSWPVFYGAAASTYEVASTRGERYRRSDGVLKQYIDPVQRHFVASLSTAESVSDSREKLLKDFRAYQLDAVELGKKDKAERFFILPNIRDRAGNHKLVTLLARNKVKVHRATTAFRACKNQYQSGAYIIDTAQSRGRYAKTVLTRQVNMGDAFIKEQERLRARKLSNEIYDVTAWSLPLMFNLDVETCGKVVNVKQQAVNGSETLGGNVSELEGDAVDGAKVVAYIVPWGDMAAGRFLTGALRSGVSLKSADETFTLKNGTKYPAGSLIVEVANNETGIAEKIQALANASGANVFSTDSSWVIAGPSFGSENTVRLKAPSVAMAWDSPTNSLSAGNTRFVIEQQMGYPVTAIRSRHLKTADLSHYHVLILPSGNYESTLGKSGAENLSHWVERGGVLITLGGATRYAADAGLLETKLEDAVRDGTSNRKEGKEAGYATGTLIDSGQDLLVAMKSDRSRPDYVSGVLANIEVDQEHWLTAGVHHSVVSLVAGQDIFVPIKLNAGKNVAWFKGADELLASGYLYDENRQQLAYKPFLIHQPTGRGMVVSFTQDPALRGHFDGLNVLLMNTIFRGAAHARPQR